VPHGRGQSDIGSIQISLNFLAWPLQGAAIYMFQIMHSIKNLLGTLQYSLLDFTILFVMPIFEPLRKIGAHYDKWGH
jgi:hypothetical protein